MTERDKELAEQAGFWKEHTNTWMCTGEDIETFADLIRADEREACALICDEHADDPVYCGAAIRARGDL